MLHKDSFLSLGREKTNKPQRSYQRDIFAIIRLLSARVKGRLAKVTLNPKGQESNALLLATIHVLLQRDTNKVISSEFTKQEHTLRLGNIEDLSFGSAGDDRCSDNINTISAAE